MTRILGRSIRSCHTMNTYLTWCLAIAGSTTSAFPTAQTPGLIPGPASGIGKAIVVNSCNFPVYYKSVTNYDPLPSNIDAGSSYSEIYRPNPNGGGVSIKISSNQSIGTASDMMGAFDQSTIIQFEYTLNLTQAMVYYDISNVNGYYPSVDTGSPWPFEEYGLILEGSDNECTTVTCLPGVQTCTAAYTLPNDNWATHGCMYCNTLVLTLCSTTGASGYFKRNSINVSSVPSTGFGKDLQQSTGYQY